MVNVDVSAKSDIGIVSNRDANGEGFTMGLYDEPGLSNYFSIQFNDEEWVNLSSWNGSIKDDYECIHLAISQANDGKMVFYINGKKVEINFINQQYDISTQADWRIGIEFTDSLTTAYKGTIQEVRIWKTLRTEEQIAKFINVDLSGREEGLLGYWKLDEGLGQQVKDYSQYYNHGYLGSTLSVDVHDPQWVTSCIVNKCSENILTVSDTALCDGQTITVVATGDSSYTWYDVQNSKDILSQDSIYQVLSTSDQQIVVKGGFCERSDTLNLTFDSIKECYPIKVYQLVTSNTDAKNQYFRIENIEYYTEHKLYVYNQWEQEVFSSDNYKNDWEMKELPAGNYYYHLTVSDLVLVGKVVLKK